MKNKMTFRIFFKDRLLLFLGWFAFVLLTILIMWLTPDYPMRLDTVLYLLFVEFVLLVIILVIKFFSKRRFWEKLSLAHGQDPLQRHLQGAHLGEEQLYQDYVNELIYAHQVLMEQAVANQEEQKDYIDSWVHEIKVPLAAAQLLLKTVEFDIADNKFISLENELNKINDYVEQVLYVARLDSFSKDYLIQETSLKALVQPVLRGQANYFIQKNIHFAIEGEDQQVLTDKKWLSFIFKQLISNAIKYTPENGQILIRIATNETGTFLEVQDNGIGIPKADIRRIFDKGFTGENGRIGQTHSTGLGLYLAKNLAKQLGVELSVASKVHEGTTMTLFFPLLTFYQENR